MGFKGGPGANKVAVIATKSGNRLPGSRWYRLNLIEATGLIEN